MFKVGDLVRLCNDRRIWLEPRGSVDAKRGDLAIVYAIGSNPYDHCTDYDLRFFEHGDADCCPSDIIEKVNAPSATPDHEIKRG